MIMKNCVINNDFPSFSYTYDKYILMEGTKIYIYGLLNKNNEYVYVGKSSIPYNRLRAHKNALRDDTLRMEILDEFIDLEFKWIHKLSKTHPLTFNKSKDQELENWNVGDIITTKDPPSTPVYDSVNDITYKSKKDAMEALGISMYLLNKKLQENNQYQLL